MTLTGVATFLSSRGFYWVGTDKNMDNFTSVVHAVGRPGEAQGRRPRKQAVGAAVSGRVRLGGETIMVGWTLLHGLWRLSTFSITQSLALVGSERTASCS